MSHTYTIWLTRLSCSGKNILAKEIEKILVEEGKKVQVLDSDIIRNSIRNIFGYSKEERMKMNKVNNMIEDIEQK
ncbi:adenylyl-sulfate kinase [Anaeromicrobium sediminis]|uniref:APS kinase domain-containing protein n=1 Tax=Anaeromicrobium sediminis TaxID=1478221 RepID=A0A267MML3_9FIRM|nr:adenylyl-sulfate kinase [Anaeromicrobium sediminis]PAB60652.1 hypothetical protein CCE28_03675 [Anaeromicrobium sediminis]